MFIPIFLFGCNTALIQFNYTSTNTKTIPETQNKLCRNSEHYIPDSTLLSATPIRFVKLNFHIIYDENGTNNFPKEEGIEYIQQLILQANSRLANNTKMFLPIGNTTPVLPIRVQYVLTGKTNDPNDIGIYFHNDSLLWYIDKKGAKNNVYSPLQFEKYGIQKNEVINIFMLEHAPDSLNSPTYRATGDGICNGVWGKLINCYNESKAVIESRSKGEWKPFDVWSKGGLLNHEIGHCLGLSHTWNQHDGCDDTPYHPNCWDQYAERPGCDSLFSNNMMDYNNQQMALTPCQIGKIQANIVYQSHIKNLLLNTWCEPKYFDDVIVSRNTEVVWNCQKLLEGNIILKPGSRLTINCPLSMPKNSRIVVKKRALLTINNTYLQNDCNLPWKGIFIDSDKKNQGQVILNNSVLLNLNTSDTSQKL